MSNIFGPSPGIFGPGPGGGGAAAPSVAPKALVTAITTTTFTITITAVSGQAGTTGALQYRARGSNATWTTGATQAPPVVGTTMQATGLTTDAPLEWRIIEYASPSSYADGTHGEVVPDATIWPTLQTIVVTACAGAGVPQGNTPDNAGIVPYSDVYVGQYWPMNVPERAILLKSMPERVMRHGNNVKLLCYTISVRIQVEYAEEEGTVRKGTIENIQSALRQAFDQESRDKYPSIPGLEIINATIHAKDDAAGRDDEFEDFIRARMDIEFEVWESRA